MAKYTINNTIFSEEELLEIAESKGYTLEELFEKNPGLKPSNNEAEVTEKIITDPTKEGKENSTTEEDATVAEETVAPESTELVSENGSLEPPSSKLETDRYFIGSGSSFNDDGTIKLRGVSGGQLMPVELEEVSVTAKQYNERKKKEESEAANKIVKLNIEEYQSPAESLVEKISTSDQKEDPKDMSAATSLFNTTINALNQLTGIDERAEYLGAFIGSDKDLVYNIFGEELGQKLLKDNKKRLSNVNEKINKLNDLGVPTIGFTDIPDKSGLVSKAAGGIAASLNAISAFGTSAAISASTFGVGLATEMIAGSIKTYNDQLANSKGITFDQLVNRGEAETLIPTALGALGYSLERAGIKNVTNSINKMSNSAKKGFFNLLQTSGGEGTTEWAQGGVEMLNDALGQGKSLDDASEIAYNFMFSSEGVENLLQGLVGGAGISMGGKFLKAASGVRTNAENETLQNQIREYSSLEDQKYKKSLTPDELNIINKSQEEIKIKLTKTIDKNNTIVASMNEDQINSINNNMDLITSLNNEAQTIIKSENLDDTAKQAALNQIKTAKTSADKEIYDIRNKAEKLASNINNLQKQAETIEDLEVEVFSTVKETKSFLKENNISAKEAKESSNAQGFIVDLNGKKTIVINRQQANKDQAVNVGSHEFLHYLLSKTIDLDNDAANQLGKSLENYLNNIDINLIKDSGLKKRLGLYKEFSKEVQNEELLTLFSDAIAEGSVPLKDNVITRLGSESRRFFQDLGIKIKFNKDKDVFNFIRDYNKSMNEGRLTTAQKKLTEGAAKINLPKQADEESEIQKEAEAIIKESKSEKVTVLEAVNKLVPQDITTQKEYQSFINDPRSSFPKLFNAINEQGGVINNYIRSISTSPEEVQKTVERLVERTIKFNPEALRKETKKAVGIEAFGERIFADIQYARKGSRLELYEKREKTKRENRREDREDGFETLAAPETEIEVAEKAPTKKLKEVKEILSEENQTELKNVVAKLELTEDQLTFKTLPNAAIEIFAKQIGIPAKKFDGKANFTRDELDKVINFIEENIDTIRQALPEAAIAEGSPVSENLIGTATGVPTNILKNSNLYTRQDRGTRLSGLIPYIKNKGINNSSILKAIGNVDGRRMAGPRDKAAQTAKGLINVLAKFATNQEVRKQKTLTPKQKSNIEVGKGSRLLFSKSMELPILNSLNIGGNNNNLLSVKYSKSSRDAYKKILIGKRPELKDASEQIDNLFKWVDTLNIPENKKSKYEKLALFYMGNGNLILPEDGYKVEDAIKVGAKNKLDPFSYKNPNELLEKFAGDISLKKINLDNLSTFSNKQELNDGITTYEIEDSRAGQSDVRKIIDSNWGKKANPWCLAALIDGNLDQAWDYWKRYSGKKQIAFQNNKLLAFNAFDQYNPLADPRWYDRMDKATEGLVFYKKINDPRGLKLKLELNTKNNSTKQIGYEVGSPKSNFYQEYNIDKELAKEIKRTATSETFFEDVRKTDTIDQWEDGVEGAKFEMIFYTPIENGILEEDPIDFEDVDSDLRFWDKRTAILTVDPSTKKDRYGNRKSTNSKYIYEGNNQKYIVEAKEGGEFGYTIKYKELNGVKFLTGRDIINNYIVPDKEAPSEQLEFEADLKSVAKLIGTTYNQLLREIQDTAFLLDSDNKPIIPIKFPFLTINNKGEFEIESINEINNEIDNQSANPPARIKYSISFDYNFTKPGGGIAYQKQKASFIKKGEIFQEKFGSIKKQRGSVRGSHVITAKAFFKDYDTMSKNQKAIAQKETIEIRNKAIEYKVQSGVKSLLEPEDSPYGKPQDNFGRTPKEIEKSIADGVVEKENKKNVRIWNEMWKNRIYDLLESNPDMIDYIETFLELSNNDLSHPQRGGAEFTAFDPNAKGEKVQIKIEEESYNPKTNKFEEGVIKEVIKTLEYEHAKPSNIVRKELLKEAKRLIKKGENKTLEEKVKLKAQFGEFVNNARKNYALWAIAYSDARKIDKANLAHKMPKGETILWKRYFNKMVAKYGGINPKKLLTIIGTEIGPSVADTFGIKNEKGELTEFGKNQLKLSKSISKAAVKNNLELPKSQRLPKGSTNEQVFPKMQELDDQANEARIKYSKSQDLDDTFNKIIENKTGIATYQRFDKAGAAVKGASKEKFNFFIPPSAEDFVGLLYKTLGKGKVGDSQMQFYKDNLLDPYGRAMNDVSSARVAMFEDYKTLKEDLKIIPKDLNKKSVEEYTKEQAVRVYIWNQQENKIPGIFKTNQQKLVDYVNENSDLKTFADQLMAMQKGDGYVTPKEGWLAGTITTDLLDSVNSIKRKKYLEQWQTNVDEMFGESNMNKLEAAFGKPYRRALEDALSRMKSGRNKKFTTGNEQVDSWTNWVNNSVGTIMFLNSRSAILQTLSTVNFINFEDNNIFKAGAAFANQPQYWKDFKFLFNSDFLKERRGGLKFNVSESEIADAAKKGGARGVVSKILQAGFLPTQMADSFAIAAGGATFYRNRLNTYLKQTDAEGNKLYTEAEAQEKTFLDFRETAEETQQSSRPDRISMEQAGPLGRTILAFANTPAQYTRKMKKAALDIKNGRGSLKANISRLIYYGVAQNIIFGAAQAAMFSLAFGDGDEEDQLFEEKSMRIANGTADSILRGAGLYGAIAATIKNTAIKLLKESKKGRTDYFEAGLVELAGISPPIQSKVKKWRSATKSYEYNKKEMAAKGFSLDSPSYLAGANVIAAFTNLPTDRVVKKVTNVYDAMQEDVEVWKRTALLMGWSKWELEPTVKKAKKKKSSRRSSSRSTSRGKSRSSNRR